MPDPVITSAQSFRLNDYVTVGGSYCFQSGIKIPRSVITLSVLTLYCPVQLNGYHILETVISHTARNHLYLAVRIIIGERGERIAFL